MKYAELVNFQPLESVIQINEADDKAKAKLLVSNYVMSDDMADKINRVMLHELNLDEVVDNKGVLLVGNYGTGKSHLMAVISSIAEDRDILTHLNNQKFANYMEPLAGRFEAVRIEIGSTQMSLRNLIFHRVQQDFKKRGITFSFPNQDEIINNKDSLEEMMELFSSKYKDKGYLIVIDEFLDYLGGRKEQDIKRDLGFMRELGEMVKVSRMRIILGVQEKLFDNPSFTFVSETLNRVKDRFEQVIIRKEDTAYVVSERILQKTDEQKAKIREHLQKFCHLYTNMSERLEEYVKLYPIHPSYFDVFNKIYIIENRQILKNISIIIRNILDDTITSDNTGIISYDSYWTFIKDNFALRSNINIKSVVEASALLEDIINRQFTKKVYKPLAIQIIYALSVHRLTTGDTSIRAGLRAEHLRDDLCLYLKDMPESNSEILLSIVQQILKDIKTTVSGQFIEENLENGQYYIDVHKTIDFDEKITQKAAVIDDSTLNQFYYHIVYQCMDWQQRQHVTNYFIYEHTLQWMSRNIFRRGYLFMGLPEERSTAQPPEDYYLYFLPPFGNESYLDDQKADEVFLLFKQEDVFKDHLKIYAASLALKELAEEKNKKSYQDKAEIYRRKLISYLNENKTTCFEVLYQGKKQKLIEVLGSRYKHDTTFKETIDLASSSLFEKYFSTKYPEMPMFKTKLTLDNQAEVIRAGIDYFAGRTNQQAKALLDSFGLIDGDKITVSKSPYAKYFRELVAKLPTNAVVNFNDIYEKNFSDEYLDKKFQLSYALLSIVFIAMIHAGDIVMELENGKLLTASELEILPRTNITDIYHFKFITKPKDIALAELKQLFELLNIPVGFLLNPDSREKGLEKLLEKTSGIARKAAEANYAVTHQFDLWGESLIPHHLIEQYKQSLKRIVDEFSNYQNKYKTVAKLRNFHKSADEMDQIAKDLQVMDVITHLQSFQQKCSSIVTYVQNIELTQKDEEYQSRIVNMKNDFRQIRDRIPNGESLTNAISDVIQHLTDFKIRYTMDYMEEHQKRRLNHQQSEHKGSILSSDTFSRLKRLKVFTFLSASKLTDIESTLSNLKTCFNLTEDKLQASPICPDCKFIIGEKHALVKGQLELIEQRLTDLLTEWTSELFNTISDPLVINHMQYLKQDQQKVIQAFLDTKQLPDQFDQYFIDSVSAVLEGFEPVVVDADELLSQLSELGASDIQLLQNKFLGIISNYTQGKDKEKVRITIRRMERTHETHES